MKIIHLLHIAYFCASSAKKVEVEEAIQPKPLQEPKKVEAEEEIQLKPLHEEQKKIQRKEKRMNFRPNHGSNLARIKSKSIRRKSKAATEFRYSFRYDCDHSSLGNEHTTNTIHFRFKDVNGITIASRAKTISSHECRAVSHWWHGWNAVDVETESQLDFAYVELETYGGDAFLIDRAQIWKMDNSQPGGNGGNWHYYEGKTFGVDNGGCYCLSTGLPDYGSKCGYKLKFYFKDVGSREAGSCWRWRTI